MTATYATRPGQPYPASSYPAHQAASAASAGTNAPAAGAHMAAASYTPANHSLANFASGPIPDPETSTPIIPLAKRPLFTPKVVVWSMLGLLAAAYMGTMLLAPALLDDLAPTAAYITDPQSDQGQRVAARLVSDVSGLKESMAQVQLELSKVKTEIATSADRAKAMNAQLMALEQRLAQTSRETLDASEPEAGGDLGQRGATASNSPAPPAAPAATAPKIGSPEQPKLVNAQPAGSEPAEQSAMETGSVSQAAKASGKTAVKPAGAKPKTMEIPAGPIDFGAAVVQPATPPVGLQISSGASIDSLRLSWSLLSDRHGDTLKNLQPRYVARGDVDHPTYDLIAGPIQSRSEAQRLCKALAARNVPCTVGDYMGASL